MKSLYTAPPSTNPSLLYFAVGSQLLFWTLTADFNFRNLRDSNDSSKPASLLKRSFYSFMCLGTGAAFAFGVHNHCRKRVATLAVVNQNLLFTNQNLVGKRRYLVPLKSIELSKEKGAFKVGFKRTEIDPTRKPVQFLIDRNGWFDEKAWLALFNQRI